MSDAIDLPHLLAVLESEERIAQRSDHKALTLLSVLGVVLVFFIVHLPNIPTAPWMIVTVLSYYIALLTALVSLLLVILPRVASSQITLPNGATLVNPVFYSGICRFPTAAAYADHFRETLADPAQRFLIFADSIHALGRINARKNHHLRRGLLAFAAAIFFELAIVIAVYGQTLMG